MKTLPPISIDGKTRLVVKSEAVPPETIDDPGVQACLSYWTEKKGDAFAPKWSEFRLYELPARVLPYLLVLDVAPGPPPTFTYRYWGTGHTQYHRRDYTGKTLEDMADQFKQIRKMGSLDGILGMLPGAAKVKNAFDQHNVDDKMIARQEAIILSMTVKERRNPKAINGSRRKRIAAGSGTTVPEVNRLLKQYRQMADMMKKAGKKGGLKGLMGGMPPGMMPPGMPR